MTIFRTFVIQPAAVKAHVIVEAARLCVKGVMEEAALVVAKAETLSGSSPSSLIWTARTKAGRCRPCNSLPRSWDAEDGVLEYAR
ncbi:MAG: hypothetical protein WDO18_11035 [Acidobacteriota bacterium]